MQIMTIFISLELCILLIINQTSVSKLMLQYNSKIKDRCKEGGLNLSLNSDTLILAMIGKMNPS